MFQDIVIWIIGEGYVMEINLAPDICQFHGIFRILYVNRAVNGVKNLFQV